jgi:glycosyltransferase involved in cell wall biosynthesis
MNPRPPLYFFNWPSHVGGADTKVTHLLLLLHRAFDITVVPNRREQLLQLPWRKFLKRLGVKAALLADLPKKLHGTALSLCNGEFFAGGIACEAKVRGLRVVWSSEMMWHHAGERAAVLCGLVDRVLYVSEVQRAALEPGYVLKTVSGKVGEWVSGRGGVPLTHSPTDPLTVASVITGNYIAPEMFPFSERVRAADAPLVIGRLSRPDPAKFPADFPEFYESLDVKAGRVGGAGKPFAGRAALSSARRGEASASSTASLRFQRGAVRTPRPTSTKFRVMAWSEELAKVYARHRFDARWELLPKAAESQVAFLHSLDLFVYSLGPTFRESWGRAVVDAMLTGAVPLVPRGGGHHLENLVPHGVAGFLCAGPEEYREHVARLRADAAWRKKLSRAARRHAEHELCNRAEHLRVWRAALA